MEGTRKAGELIRSNSMARSEVEQRVADWADFDAWQKLSVEERLTRGCLNTFKPVMDEGPGYRSWETMEDYRQWCEANLPEWLGYRRVTDEEWKPTVDRAMKE